MTIPFITILFMILNALLCVLIPVGIGIYLNKKYQLKWSLFFIGAGTFIVFALILEQIFHSIIYASSFGTILDNNIWILALYGGLAAGGFEETGRFVAFKLIIKKNPDPKTSLMVGIGHGGIEAIILVALTMLSNAIVSIMINTGSLAIYVTDTATLNQIYDSMQPLVDINPLMMLLSLWERIYAMTFHLSMSVLVYKAIKERKRRYFILALVAHAAFDFLVVILANNINVVLTTAIMTILTAGIAYFVYIKLKEMINKFKQEQLVPPLEEPSVI